MINLYTDSYFQIGHAHLALGKPCQDYAMAGTLDGAAYAVLADGCSTGGHTDVGARMITLSKIAAIKKHWAINRDTQGTFVVREINFEQQIMQSGVRESLGLTQADMLATSLYAYVSEKGGFVHIQGDGVIAIRLRDGTTILRRYEWLDNMPFYPAYLEMGVSPFVDAHGGDVSAKRFTEDVWVHTPEGKTEQYGEEHYTISQGIQGVTVAISEKFTAEDVEFIALFSDGVTQVDGVDWKDAVLEFLAYKGVAGEFVKRRMIRGIKDMQKRTSGKGPLDDISCAVIRIESALAEEVKDEYP